jgi:hypothetical protein
MLQKVFITIFEGGIREYLMPNEIQFMSYDR